MSIANTTIRLKRSEVSGNVPTSLDSGEVAINTADGLLFYKDPNNQIKSISTGSRTNSFSTINVSSTLLFATSNSDILSIGGDGTISVTGDSISDTITIGVANGTTNQKGVVRLYDGVDSNSITLSATANAVNTVHELANLAYYTALSGGGNLTTNYVTHEFYAEAGQLIFVIPGGYVRNQLSVHINGVLLSTIDYVAHDGISIFLSQPTSAGDIVSVGKWFFDDTMYLSAIQKYDQFTSNSGQYLFSTNTNYTPGFIKVYRNGILLEDSEFTATDGANVSLTHAASANDIVTLHYWGSSSIETAPVYVAAQSAISIAQSAYDAANNASGIKELSYANLYSVSITTSSNNANQVIDTFSSNVYRSVKYQIQISTDTHYQCSEIVLLHNGINSFLTEYGLICSNTVLANYDTNIIANNVQLLISPVNSINTIKFVKTSIVV